MCPLRGTGGGYIILSSTSPLLGNGGGGTMSIDSPGKGGRSATESGIGTGCETDIIGSGLE